jgi:thioredoxin-related protein
MKKLLFVIAAVFILNRWVIHAKLPEPLELVDTGVSGELVEHDFQAIIADDQTIAELQTAGKINIIEVSSPTCSVCKQLERRIPAFLEHRGNVVFHKINAGNMSMQLTAKTAEELKEVMANWKAKFAPGSEYYVPFTPYISIYDSKGQLLAKDDVGNTRGAVVLEYWLSKAGV